MILTSRKFCSPLISGILGQPVRQTLEALTGGRYRPAQVQSLGLGFRDLILQHFILSAQLVDQGNYLFNLCFEFFKIVVPSSHYDFGFVEPPSAIRERAARHIDEVIRTAEENRDFRWTIESVWQINEWLKRQKKPSSVLPKDKEKIARLVNLIRSGQIVLSTSWGSMHTDFMGNEELNRINYDFARWSSSYGISSEVAYMNDVPGHPMSVASVLADSGTKYLVTGANTFINNATDLAPGKVPFYWESLDGNKVLLWISQGNSAARETVR